MTDVVQQAAEFWNVLWRNARWADLFDVLTIFVLLSLTAHWLWRRASRAVIVALSIVLGLYVVAHLLRMYLTLLLFQVGVTVIVVALILLFRHDLRRAFERLAAWRPERPSQRSAVRARIIDTLAEAVTLLANEKIGALIVIPGREPVEHHIRGGIPLEGRMSVPLFHSIFHPESSGHDGAALVEGEHVELFGVHLPLSRNLQEVGRSGTRHTAALGLAERCDAFVIVVSEERGTISIAERGRLMEVDSAAEFSDRLLQFYQHLYPRRRERVRQWAQPYSLAINVGTLATAMLLWYFLAFRVETVQRSFEAVPIEFRNLPKDWIIAESQPSRVTLTLAGPQRAFDHLEREQLLVSLDLDRIRPGRQTLVIDESAVTMPADVSLEQVDQETVTVTAYPGRRVELPVKPDLRGTLPESLVLEEARVEPATLRVIVAADTPGIAALTTEPINLAELTESETWEVALDLPEGVALPEDPYPTVRVHLKVKRKEPPPMPDAPATGDQPAPATTQ